MAMSSRSMPSCVSTLSRVADKVGALLKTLITTETSGLFIVVEALPSHSEFYLGWQARRPAIVQPSSFAVA